MARVALLTGDGFEDSEFEVPLERLKKAGHQVDVMGSQAGETIRGKRGKVEAGIDVAAQSAYPDHYDMLVIPGGFGPDRLRMDEGVVSFVRGFMHADKPVAAICHGPQLLIEAGAVRGRVLTSWPSVRTDLINAGANWVDEPVVVDGNLITSRKPDDLDDFCKRIEAELAKGEANQHTKQDADADVATPNMDEDGFLRDPDAWDEKIAQWLAKQEGLGDLSEARWQVIYALRQFYMQHHTVPDFRRVCEAARQKDVYCMERLFDNDGSKAWRIAGLPNPGEELKAYL